MLPLHRFPMSDRSQEGYEVGLVNPRSPDAEQIGCIRQLRNHHREGRVVRRYASPLLFFCLFVCLFVRVLGRVDSKVNLRRSSTW